MADMTMAALKAEIDADPTAKGFKTGAVWKDDQVIADLLNNPAGGPTITRRKVKPVELVESYRLSEYIALTNQQRAYLSELVGLGGVIDTSQTEVFNALQGIFGVGSATRTNVLAKIQRPGSRAEVLWGEGTVISASHVSEAANL